MEQIIYIKMDLALNNLYRLICHKTKPNQTKPKNKLKDIHPIIRGLKEKKSLILKFRYVHTDQNHANLLTRGITLEKLQQDLRFWCLGPEWLSKSPIEWPASEFQFLSSKNKFIVQSALLNYIVTNSESQPVIPFDKYSSFNKLLLMLLLIYLRSEIN